MAQPGNHTKRNFELHQVCLHDPALPEGDRAAQVHGGLDSGVELLVGIENLN